ncbi:C2H2 transcription factor-like protein [Rhexocercosporidium sp. MPI-PUGE-AT-0058]|nr:C2H2 transcription factor-like protein [Rhexocercosporidium sp. MPI-PUGE-AT-0058]
MEPHNSTAQGIEPPPPNRFQCLECHQTFGRVEHLTRHSRSHQKERSLKCSFCRKGFYRIDALRRHEQVHREPKRSYLGKGARACFPCASARRKCTGDCPCLGCQKRSLECNFPISGDRTTSRQPQASSNTVSLRDESSPQSAVDRFTASSHDSPMSWSNTSGSPSHGQGLSIRADMTQNSPRMQTLSPHLSQESHMQTTSAAPLPNSQVPLNRQELELPDYHARKQVLEGDHLSPPRTSSQGHPQLQSLEPQFGINNCTLDPPPTPWFNGSFQSINWLPENWTPDFQMNNGEPPSPFDRDQVVAYANEIPSRYQDRPRNFSLAGSLPLQSSSPQTAGLNDISSPGSHSTQSAGRFYVDGDGARLPRVRKAPYGQAEPRHHNVSHATGSLHPLLMFPDLGQVLVRANGPALEFEKLPISVYDEISRFFHLTCVSSTVYSNFYGDSFPSLQSISHFIWLFTRYFRSSLPFLHPATFDISSTHWLLILAIAAVGSHYAEIESSGSLVVAMHEFLRRALTTAVEFEGNSKPSTLVLAQVKLLSCIGMMYCGDDRLQMIAKSYHSDLAAYCTSYWTVYCSEASSTDSQEEGLDWQAWIQTETTRRTGYCIWLLDCMWSFHFQMRPLLTLGDAKVPIPCQEVLWEAESSLDWQQLYACAAPSASLHETIQLAYIEKRLQSSTGEFSRILCVHALFHRTWEVEKYFKQPLTLWTPTAEKQDVKNIESSLPIWLPGNPTYSKWRNSACDCLDILHWHANSVIGAASGMEHPTVLHLHLARVILLTPIQQILDLTRLLTDTSAPPNEPQVTSLRKHIQRWALDDQHKARLAIIHAGVLFWHVRRYSSDAFHEPSSVLLGALSLWAYGTFAPHAPPKRIEINNTTSPVSAPQDFDEDVEATSVFPTSIQLDRPADDELVQLFVKRGQSMRANITGVGNLCSAKGPLRVLNEGQNLLKGLKIWGEGKGGIERLRKLSEVCILERDAGRLG